MTAAVRVLRPAPVREGGAERLGVELAAPDGTLLGRAEAQRRRTARLLRVDRFEAAPDHAGPLAEALLGLCPDAAVIRAAEPLPALGLAETGRGYHERWLGAAPQGPDVGQWIQTTGFTCGPAVVGMALVPGFDRAAEFDIWREATVVVAPGGPGGCDPWGLALAAERRTARPVVLHCDAEGPLWVSRMADAEKRGILTFVQERFRAEAAGRIGVVQAALPVARLGAEIARGALAFVLVDQFETHGWHIPHWLLVHGLAGGDFLVNDPWVDPEDGETALDGDRLPISPEALAAMAGFGEPRVQATILVG